MAKKGGGFFDDFFKKPYGGLVDFNHDGRESLSEQWLALKIAEECRKNAEGSKRRGSFSADDIDFMPRLITSEKSSKQDNANAGDNGKPAAENKIEIPISINISWEGNDNENQEKRCQFIRENKGNIVAASYLTESGEFLFSQAVKDNFSLSVTLPAESERSEYSPTDIFLKIEREDCRLACDVWAWLISQFLPYCEYAPDSNKMLTSNLVDIACTVSEESQKVFRMYLHEHRDFSHAIVQKSKEMSCYLGKLVVGLVKDNLTDTAEELFADGLHCANGEWKKINDFFDDVIAYAKDYEELETMEFIEEKFLPVMKKYDDGMIADEIPVWEKAIAEYKDYVEQNSEKYVCTRKNAWRLTVPDGKEYHLEPRWYSTEEEYLQAYKEAKYAWRKLYIGGDNFGLDPNQFESRQEFCNALQAHRVAELRRLREKDAKQREEFAVQQNQAREQREAVLAKDKTIYTYCGVKLPFAEQPYSYRTEDNTIQIGDSVVVPVGKENKEAIGQVVSIGQYARVGVPFPVEHAKFVLRKL